uniref:sensor histidine kinase n=1 Tax=Flavobacterium sp. TaxID=239 RepID=UPI00404A333B
MNDYEAATNLLLNDIKYSSQNKLITSTIGACIGLSKNYLAQKKNDLANVYADSAHYYFLINNDEKVDLNRVSYKFYKDYYSIKQEVFNNLFLKDSSNFYLQMLTDTLNSQITRINLENEINKKKRYEIEFETAKSISLKKENTQNKFLFLLVFLVLILMILLTFFQWNHNRNLKRQQAQILEQKNQLEKINSQKNLFLGILSHDIRGPIINLKELLDLNKKEIIDDKEFLTYKNQIGLSIDGLSSTLENLLSWVKNNFDNEVKVNLKSHSLSNLIMKVQLEVISQLLNKKINLSIQNTDSKQPVYCDEDLFSIVMRNLINNAMKFSSEESTITISISKAENNRVQISIIDEGVGMTEDEMNKLFEKTDKYQTQSAKGTEGEKGFGLGLQICYDFLQKMNGTIRVQSQKNVGSTFIVELPESEATS